MKKIWYASEQDLEKEPIKGDVVILHPYPFDEVGTQYIGLPSIPVTISPVVPEGQAGVEVHLTISGPVGSESPEELGKQIAAEVSNAILGKQDD